MPEFVKGDIVRLLSGGPAMTVVASSPAYPGVLCMWFDADGKGDPHRASFCKDTLKKVELSFYEDS